MSLPRLLLVDDSEAILAYERAALGEHYELLSVQRGAAALQLLAQQPFDAVLLDLSMPEMDGDEVLRRMRADPALQGLPVVIVSSEADRGAACLQAGAQAFLEKPPRAELLRGTVARVLEERRSARRAASVAILPVVAGGVTLGLPIAQVRAVVQQLEAWPLTGGPAFVPSYTELQGEKVAVLDLPARLGHAHAQPLEERLLVLLEGTPALFVSVDAVLEPAVLDAEAVRPARGVPPLAPDAVLHEGRELPVVQPAKLLENAPQLLQSALAQARAVEQAG